MDQQTAGDDDVHLVDAFREPSINAHIIGCDGSNCAQWIG